MLEDKIEALRAEVAKNTAAVLANTAALGGKAAPKATTTKAAATEDEDEAPKAYTASQVKAMALRVQKEISSPVAKELIKKHGGSDLAALIEKKKAWGAFMEAAEAKFSPAEDEAPAEDEDEL